MWGRISWGEMKLRIRRREKGRKVVSWIVMGAILLTTCALMGRPIPVQPIAFSHKTHAGTYGLACLYCHAYADRSIVAGVPPVQTCFGCHKIISGYDRPEIQPAIAKIVDYWRRQEPIPWIKVYDLPDFVYFSHKRHVKKGMACQNCHGQVQEMDQVRRVASLEMGWCLDCHRRRGVERDCALCHK